MVNNEIRLRQRPEEPGAAYLELYDYPEKFDPHSAGKTVCIFDVIENYLGPKLNLDFNSEGKLIGIEILYPIGEDDDEEE